MVDAETAIGVSLAASERLDQIRLTRRKEVTPIHTKLRELYTTTEEKNTRNASRHVLLHARALAIGWKKMERNAAPEWSDLHTGGCRWLKLS